MGSRTVLWLGGISGVGKSAAARAVARRHDLWFFPVDSRTYVHAEATGSPALVMTPDELWLDRSAEQMVEDFESDARQRFPFIVEELEALPDDGAPVLVEGPQLLPDLVRGPALFVVASPTLQRMLLQKRGSLTYSGTSDPERAFENRVRRDVLFAERLRAAAPVVEVSAVTETEPVVGRFVGKHAAAWIGRAERGDVAARRRQENETRFDQWTRYGQHKPRAREGTVEFACECDRPGCIEVVQLSLVQASRTPRFAH